mmetsp:Transcript_20294/g.37139  ORF Transcript_20294/g.37139 Transcript_20294/m.37139 type:complete len:227 (+) Transcript_20294:458-1138(+)
MHWAQQAVDDIDRMSIPIVPPSVVEVHVVMVLGHIVVEAAHECNHVVVTVTARHGNLDVEMPSTALGATRLGLLSHLPLTAARRDALSTDQHPQHPTEVVVSAPLSELPAASAPQPCEAGPSQQEQRARCCHRTLLPAAAPGHAPAPAGSGWSKSRAAAQPSSASPAAPAAPFLAVVLEHPPAFLRRLSPQQEHLEQKCHLHRRLLTPLPVNSWQLTLAPIQAWDV